MGGEVCYCGIAPLPIPPHRGEGAGRKECWCGAPAGEDLGPEFWAKAVLVAPRKPKSVHLKLDPEVFDYFVQITGGKGHLTRMQAVLKAYVEAMR